MWLTMRDGCALCLTATGPPFQGPARRPSPGQGILANPSSSPQSHMDDEGLRLMKSVWFVDPACVVMSGFVGLIVAKTTNFMPDLALYSQLPSLLWTAFFNCRLIRAVCFADLTSQHQAAASPEDCDKKRLAIRLVPHLSRTTCLCWGFVCICVSGSIRGRAGGILFSFLLPKVSRL